jgi:hypothetical protein
VWCLVLQDLSHPHVGRRYNNNPKSNGVVRRVMRCQCCGEDKKKVIFLVSPEYPTIHYFCFECYRDVWLNDTMLALHHMEW